MAKDISSD